MSHARQTEHYELPLYDGTDIINPLTDFNNANETIDEAVYNANQRSVSAETIAQNAKTIAESYETRVTQAIDTANAASSLATNTQAMIADEFSATKEGGYKVGDFVIYNGVLYRFINAHTGAWDASDVQVSPVLIDAISDVVDEGKQDIADAVTAAEEEIAGQTEKVTKTQAMIAEPFDENKTGGYAVGEIVTYADKLYKFTSTHSGAWTGLDVEQVDVIESIDARTSNKWGSGVSISSPYTAPSDGIVIVYMETGTGENATQIVNLNGLEIERFQWRGTSYDLQQKFHVRVVKGDTVSWSTPGNVRTAHFYPVA